MFFVILRTMNPEKIIFKNEPNITGHEVDKKRDDRKLEMIPHVEAFVAGHSLFEGKEVRITFPQDGVSSLVSIIEVENMKYVLKIPLKAHPIEGEAEFLMKWGEEGVSVPEIIEEGLIEDRPYILMKFIDARNLRGEFSFKEMQENGTFAEMGEALSKMHQVKSMGYGRLKDGKPEYPTFSSFLSYDEGINKKLREVKGERLLEDDLHGSISSALGILRKAFSLNPQSSYCHNDFGPTNVFATQPLTVFDPDPILNHPYMDLARSVLITVSQSGMEEAATQMIEGYFKGKSYDAKLLHAAFVLNAHTKVSYWTKTKKTERVENTKRYLEAHKNLLDE